jgi:hypothetical protein
VHIIQQGLTVESPDLAQTIKNGPAQAKQQAQDQGSSQAASTDPRSADGVVTLSVSAAALQASDTDSNAGSSGVDPTALAHQEGAGQNLIDNLQDYLTSVRQGLASTNSSITGEATSSDIMSKINSLFTSADVNA